MGLAVQLYSIDECTVSVGSMFSNESFPSIHPWHWARRRNKSRQSEQSEEEVTEEHVEHDSPSASFKSSVQNGQNLRSAATSLLVTASHLLLYLPALLLLGLQGTVVNPVAAALCALIVYSEFLIHPMVLLSTSQRMRQEIIRTLKRHSCC